MASSSPQLAPARSADKTSTPSEERGGASPGRSGLHAALRGSDLAAQIQMLAPRDVVQRHGGGTDTGDVHAAAARGIAGGGGQLPHYERIQQSFGHHDVSGVQAHVGGPAREATASMGASAYATGNHVAFGGSPDLHTAAHEAAHVVQQRAGVSLKGGVGQVGDGYERHADAVADKVVRGESAATLLDEMSGGGGGGSQTQRRAIQRHALGVVQMDKTDKEKAHEQEQSDGGHSLLRHGPEVSEDALKRRLKTGMTAKIGGGENEETYSPAPGLVTKFKSYGHYNQTRAAAAAEANRQLGVVKAGLKDVCDAFDLKLTAFNTAKKELDEADNSTKAAKGKAFGAARGELTKAQNAIKLEAATYSVATKDGLPVSFTAVKDPTSGMDMLSLKPAYKCVVNHGGAIGIGFRGVGQKSGQTDTIYDDVSDQEDIPTTQTAFNATVKKLADATTTEAATWTAGQHYPCDPAETVGISA